METNFKWLVYKTTNKKNGKYYIGISYEDPDNIDKDFLGSGIYKNDPYTYQYSKTPLQWAVKTDGVNNFERTIIGIFDNPKIAQSLFKTLINKDTLQNRNIYNNFLLINLFPIHLFDVNGGSLVQGKKQEELKFVYSSNMFVYCEACLSGNSFKDINVNYYTFALDSEYVFPNKNGEIEYEAKKTIYSKSSSL